MLVELPQLFPWPVDFLPEGYSVLKCGYAACHESVCFCGKSGFVSHVHRHLPSYFKPSSSIPHRYILAFKINFHIKPVKDETRECVFLSSAPFCPVRHCLAWFETSHRCYWGFRSSGMWCCETAFVFPNFRWNLVPLSSNHPVTRRHVTEDLNLQLSFCHETPCTSNRSTVWSINESQNCAFKHSIPVMWPDVVHRWKHALNSSWCYRQTGDKLSSMPWLCMREHVHNYTECNSQMPVKVTEVQALEVKAIATRLESWTTVEVWDVFWFVHAQAKTSI